MLLALAAIAGEFGRFHAQAISGKAWFSLVYLIIAGSIISYTAYVWLLEYESPTKVGTYAYVNPVVAVILGAGLGGETIGRPVGSAEFEPFGVGEVPSLRLTDFRGLWALPLLLATHGDRHAVSPAPSPRSTGTLAIDGQQLRLAAPGRFLGPASSSPRNA